MKWGSRRRRSDAIHAAPVETSLRWQVNRQVYGSFSSLFPFSAIVDSGGSTVRIESPICRQHTADVFWSNGCSQLDVRVCRRPSHRGWHRTLAPFYSSLRDRSSQLCALPRSRPPRPRRLPVINPGFCPRNHRRGPIQIINNELRHSPARSLARNEITKLRGARKPPGNGDLCHFHLTGEKVIFNLSREIDSSRPDVHYVRTFLFYIAQTLSLMSVTFSLDIR